MLGGRFVQQLLQLQVHAVAPAESDDIVLVAGADFYVGVAADHVVFLADSAVVGEAAVDRAGKLTGNAARIVVKAIGIVAERPACGVRLS